MDGATRDGTGRGLVDFLDYLANKGLMNRSTAMARKSAAKKVLAIDEGWERIDLRSLDLGEQFDRFTRLEKDNYKPESLTVYRSRFKSAVEEYLTYLRDPSGFKAPGSGAASRSDSGNDRSVATPVQQKPGSDVTGAGRDLDVQDRASTTPTRQELVTYPFPLRGQDMMVYLQLPTDLRPDEATRLCRFLESLALPNGDETSDSRP